MPPDTAVQPLGSFHQACQRLLVGLALLCQVAGCAALSNPVADAIPVHRLPPEVHGERKDEERTIPLTWLRQKPPEVYRLAPGDTLGVWVENILGEKTQPPPLVPQGAGLPPALGFPILVAADGTITLPLIPPIKVEGMTTNEVQDEVVKAYTVTKKILQPGSGKVIVTLMRPRTYHILVIRQDTGAQVSVGGAGVAAVAGAGGGGGGFIGQTKRGTGYAIDLPAYENDVLNALTRTGGLPGLDAENEVIIERGNPIDFNDPEAMRRCLERGPAQRALGPTEVGNSWVRIPLRMRPGETPPFRPDDIVLHDGDIIFIEARDTEVFYTGGLLPPHQFPVPRDYDLDCIEAISFIGGPFINGGINGSNLSGNLLQSGLGFPSPSLLVVLRKTPGGGQIPIRIDINKALRDPRERLLVKAGDILLLQETPAEAVTRYITEQLHFNWLATLINRKDLTVTGTLTVP